MSRIDDTIARIPGMTRKEREVWRKKAEGILRKDPNNADATQLKAALDATEAARPPASRLEVTGALAWEKHQHGVAVFRAFHGEQVIGQIFKRADHSDADKDVYSVTILGQDLSGAFQHIEDARMAGEAAFVARSGSKAL